MLGGTDPSEGTPLYESMASIRSSLLTLQRLGSSDRADAALTDAEQVGARAFDALESDTAHSDSWKLQQAARRYIALMADLSRSLSAASGSVGAQDSADAATVFGTRNLPGDAGSLAISRRDCVDRVAAITDNGQRLALLQSAIRMDDRVLANAIVQQAVEVGDLDSVNQYADAYPDLTDAVQRLWTAEWRKTSSVDVSTSWRVAALKPAALQSLQDYEIQQAAAGQSGAA